MDAELERGLRELLDKQEIRDVLMLYTRGIDRHDRELIEAAFHPDAMFDTGVGQVTGVELADRVVSSGGPSRFHFVGNHVAEIDGDRAYGETYMIAVVEHQRDGKGFTRFRALRYIDQYERRDGQWKVRRRKAVDDWGRLDEIVNLIDDGGAYRSLPSNDDPIYQVREESFVEDTWRPS